jgi:Scavenger receptor cysteine-rich domain
VLGSSGYYPTANVTIPVLLRVVQCTGTEKLITDCSYQLNNGLCLHKQDAGVICIGDLLSTTTTTTITPSTTTLPPRICKSWRVNKT